MTHDLPKPTLNIIRLVHGLESGTLTTLHLFGRTHLLTYTEHVPSVRKLSILWLNYAQSYRGLESEQEYADWQRCTSRITTVMQNLLDGQGYHKHHSCCQNNCTLTHVHVHCTGRKLSSFRASRFRSKHPGTKARH